MVTPALGRAMVAHLIEQYQVSQRRACRVVGIHRTTVRYQPQRQAKLVQQAVAIERRLIAPAALRPRFGYRRLEVLLRREGYRANHKRVYRLYQQHHLTVRRKRHKRLAAFNRTPVVAPGRANQIWAMNFMQDTLVDGRQFRTLNLIDVHTREYRAIEVDTSLAGARVVRVLEQLGEVYGAKVKQYLLR